MNELMRWDPAKRPTAAQALQHPFFQVGMPVDRPVGSSSSQTSNPNRPDTLNGAGGGGGARKSVPVGGVSLTSGGGDEDYKDFKGNVSAPPVSKPSSGLAQQARYKP